MGLELLTHIIFQAAVDSVLLPWKIFLSVLWSQVKFNLKNLHNWEITSIGHICNTWTLEITPQQIFTYGLGSSRIWQNPLSRKTCVMACETACTSDWNFTEITDRAIFCKSVVIKDLCNISKSLSPKLRIKVFYFPGRLTSYTFDPVLYDEK